MSGVFPYHYVLKEASLSEIVADLSCFVSYFMYPRHIWKMQFEHFFRDVNNKIYKELKTNAMPNFETECHINFALKI